MIEFKYLYFPHWQVGEDAMTQLTHVLRESGLRRKTNGWCDGQLWMQ